MRYPLIICVSSLILCQGGIISNPSESYDYIIVGGGTSGNVLANRLSANENISVIVLEAGYEPPRLADIPLLSYRLQLSDVDWKYKTVPQKNACLKLIEKRSSWPRGKALGGSSVINTMLYLRGTRKDYDKWESNGAKGWSWNDVLPYFIKSEKNMNADIVDSGYHGLNGEMLVQKPNYFTPLAQAYVEAAKELNYSEGDYNGAHPNRFMTVQGTMYNGKRCSTYDAFLTPIIKRNNLNILVGAFATKIMFDDQKRAIAIQFDHNNKTKVLMSKNEIILSAGSINSPQLLMLSGIGPKEHLQDLGIPVVSDLPVGKNLQDHIFGGIPFVIEPKVSLDMMRIMLTFDRSNQKKDPMTSLGIETIGFINSKYNQASDWPDIELMFSSFTPASDNGYVGRFIQGITDVLWEKVFKPYVSKDTYLCMPVLLHPLSRGEIKLASLNPYEPPIIDPKYLSVPQDLKVLVEGVKKCYEIAETYIMRNFSALPLNVTFPGCEEHNKSSDEYYACMIQAYTLTTFHPCGTCKMGSEYDCTTVVDPFLRVKGVSKLRVVDASVMPTLNTGHTVAPTIMIAEKGADMILSDYKHSD